MELINGVRWSQVVEKCFTAAMWTLRVLPGFIPLILIQLTSRLHSSNHGLLYLQDRKLSDVVYLRGEKRQILAMQLNGFT